MCLTPLLIKVKRCIDTIRNVVPIKTCKPWNPVAIKNAEPNAESEIEKEASWYSKACSKENRIPNTTVVFKAVTALTLLFNNSEWWHQVTDTPEEIKSSVFNNGILIGLKGIILWGGHNCPNSVAGDTLLWKKAQKKEEKKKISETINRIIPAWIPTVTCKLWLPCANLSEKISCHQQNAISKIEKKEANSKWLAFKFTQINIESIRKKALKEASRGQGLFSTKW